MTANSVPVAAGQQATATQYNTLRSDVLDPAIGHDHDGATGVAIVRPWLPGGVDGDATIAADTWLTRDMYYNSLTINVGATLYTNGWQVFVTGVCTNNGAIKWGDLQAPWCVLSASIGSADTAFTLGTQDGTIGRFGGNAVAGAPIRLIQIEGEIIGLGNGQTVTQNGNGAITVTGTTMNVKRGLHGTAAAAHTAGAIVRLVLDGMSGADNAAINNGTPSGVTPIPTYLNTKLRPTLAVAGGRGVGSGSSATTGNSAAAASGEPYQYIGGNAGGTGGVGAVTPGTLPPGAGGTASAGTKSGKFPISAFDGFQLTSSAVGAPGGISYGLTPAPSGGGGGQGYSGAAYGVGGSGGFGGQDGGLVALYCATLAGNGLIASPGGSAGAGGAGQPHATAGGGGGGGGAGGRGGIVVLVYRHKTFSGTISVLGATGGAGGAAGSGGSPVAAAGAPGGAGVAGVIYEFVG